MTSVASSVSTDTKDFSLFIISEPFLLKKKGTVNLRNYLVNEVFALQVRT